MSRYIDADKLISRRAAIDAVWSLDVELRPSAIDAILNRLKGLPSAQQWIPCSERLPEEKGRYLITTKRFGDFVVDWNIFMIGTKIIQEGWLYSGDVIAWMPLPEPYKT